MYQRAVEQVVSDQRFTNTAMRILLFMLSQMPMENRWMRFTLKQIAMGAGVGVRSVSSAMSELVEAGILDRRGSIYHANDYRFNTSYAWRGHEPGNPRRSASDRPSLEVISGGVSA